MATIRFESQESKGKQVPAELPYWTVVGPKRTGALHIAIAAYGKWPGRRCQSVSDCKQSSVTYELQDRAAEKFSVRRA